MLKFNLQVSPDILTPILESGPQGVTGWGIALALSLVINYVIYREFKYLQEKFLNHLEKLNVTLEEIHNKFHNK